jgi:hypothetical protein
VRAAPDSLLRTCRQAGTGKAGVWLASGEGDSITIKVVACKVALRCVGSRQKGSPRQVELKTGFSTGLLSLCSRHRSCAAWWKEL